MKRENLLLATEDNQVVYIGEKLLTTLRRREMPTPFGYPAGCLAAKDLFLLVLAEAAALRMEERDLLTSLCREEIPQAGPCLLYTSMLRQQRESGKAVDRKFCARVGRRLAGLGYSADMIYGIVERIENTEKQELEDEQSI